MTEITEVPARDATGVDDAAGAHDASTASRPDRVPTIDAAGRAALGRPVVPLRHPLRWIAAALVLVLLLNFVETLFTNEQWGWPAVGKWLFSPAILTGLQLTLTATALSAVISFAGGIVVAVARLSRNPVLSGLAWGTCGCSGPCRSSSCSSSCTTSGRCTRRSASASRSARRCRCRRRTCSVTWRSG